VRKFPITGVSEAVVAVNVTPLASTNPPPAGAAAVAPSFHTREVADVFVIEITVGELSTVIVNPLV
jgi:hypothetical protein